MLEQQCVSGAVLLFLIVCFVQSAKGQQEALTSWSNSSPDVPDPSIPLTRCPPGRFIQRWIVGTGNISSNIGPLLSIVQAQGICDDGTLLTQLTGSTPTSRKFDGSSVPALDSKDGYTCAEMLNGYNNGGNWMSNFLTVGEKLVNDAGMTPLNLSCMAVPSQYVAVGYKGLALEAVDAVQLLMADPEALTKLKVSSPSPTGQPSSSPTLNTSASPNSDFNKESNSTNRKSESSLSTTTIVAIVVPALTGLAAVVTIAYTVWKWRNKRALVKAKQTADRPSSYKWDLPS